MLATREADRLCRRARQALSRGATVPSLQGASLSWAAPRTATSGHDAGVGAQDGAKLNGAEDSEMSTAVEESGDLERSWNR